jgi:hypothetical protein
MGDISFDILEFAFVMFGLIFFISALIVMVFSFGMTDDDDNIDL